MAKYRKYSKEFKLQAAKRHMNMDHLTELKKERAEKQAAEKLENVAV